MDKCGVHMDYYTLVPSIGEVEENQEDGGMHGEEKTGASSEEWRSIFYHSNYQVSNSLPLFYFEDNAKFRFDGRKLCFAFLVDFIVALVALVA